MKIGIIGGGNMGSAFAKGLKKNLAGAEIFVSDKNSKKPAVLKKFGVKTVFDNAAAAEGANVLILAVKPQDFKACLQGLRGAISKNCIVISIAAGVKISKISRLLRHKLVCRVMPNLLAVIGESMSVWFAPNLNAGQKNIVKKIVKAVGEEIELRSEDEIDKATCVSGCGPAYIWYFIENIIKAGVSLGLSEAVSRELTSRTFFGTCKMTAAAKESEKDLRLRTMSKGGMTEQAIKVFDKKRFPEIFEAVVRAAYNRAKELSR